MTAHATADHPAHPTVKTYLTVFGALLGLLVVTILAAEIEIRGLNLLIAASIATAKAVLIILFFMHVRYSTPLTWLVAGASFFFLMILFGLTMNDYWTRGMLRGAGQGNPPQQHVGDAMSPIH